MTTCEFKDECDKWGECDGVCEPITDNTVSKCELRKFAILVLDHADTLMTERLRRKALKMEED